jgi:RNase adaptor protein for sRNA GlmZ degradation
MAFYISEIDLEVNADESKYMIMSRYQNEGRSHNLKIVNSLFERVEQLKYLGTTLRSQNSILEEIESRLKSRNDCCHSFFQFAIQKYQN